MVCIGNNQKIKGKVADEIVKQRSVAKENRPTYSAVVKHIKGKYGVQLSPQRISCWWREEQANQVQKNTTNEPEQKNLDLNANDLGDPIMAEEVSSEDSGNTEEALTVEEQWQSNNVVGSFILYAMLNESQCLTPFIDNLKQAMTSCRKTVERVMLTLFFMHALIGNR